MFFLAACTGGEPVRNNGEVEDVGVVRYPPRVELLTVPEVFDGSAEVMAQVPHDRSTTCGPEFGSSLARYHKYDPDMVQFRQGHLWVQVGVFDDNGRHHANFLDYTKRRMYEDDCRLGFLADGYKGGKISQDWRVYPVDLGPDVVAFRAIEVRGQLKEGPSGEFIVREDASPWSTARAFGMVNDKLVMVGVVRQSVEIPSEEELRALWEAQVAKVQYNDALKKNKDTLVEEQSGSTATPASK